MNEEQVDELEALSAIYDQDLSGELFNIICYQKFLLNCTHIYL